MELGLFEFILLTGINYIGNRYFAAPASAAERAQEEGLMKKILKESVTFHFWNSLTYSLIPESGSLVSRLLEHTCIRCLDVL